MCGIFGIIKDPKVDYATFKTLGEANTVRGNVHFGVFMDYGQILRYACPFDADKVPQLDTELLLGHVRAPTGGQDTDGIHPFETKDFVLAHNGMILNTEKFPMWKIGEVDSQYILGGIQYFANYGMSAVDCIRNVVQKLDGQQACWLYDKRDGNIYFWRVMSPLYYGIGHREFRFSSRSHELADQALSEGHIYQFDPSKFMVMSVSPFRYYSPYKIVKG